LNTQQKQQADFTRSKLVAGLVQVEVERVSDGAGHLPCRARDRVIWWWKPGCL